MIIRALIIPSPGDPGGLLRSGWGGPPQAWRGTAKSHLPALAALSGVGHPPDGRTDWLPGCPPLTAGVAVTVYAAVQYALVLVWAGAVVPEGCDRTCRARWRAVGVAPSVIPFEWDAEAAAGLAHACEAAGLGTAVIEEVPDATE